MFLCLLFGILAHVWSDVEQINLSDNDIYKWEGQVLTTRQKGNLTEYIIRVEALNPSLERFRPFKVQAKYRDTSGMIRAGDRIAAITRFSEFNEPLLPTDFDYRAFMNKKGIWYKTYMNQFVKIGHSKNIYHYVAFAKEQIREKYIQAGLSGQNFAVLNALSLGDKNYLSAETKSNFAQAGAMHLLAVSGLHVGILFIVISKVFGFLKSKRIGRTVFALIALISVWLFAIITGLAPSVQRAAFMFSIVILAESIKRDTQVLNSIFGSAFLLLVFNPNLLFEPGFQLSYSAVISIVVLYPKLNQLFFIKNKVIRYCRDLLLISFIAQMGTLPLSIYYFHQFPNWFLLTNFFVIPLAFVIVCLSISLPLLGSVPFLFAMIGKLLNISIGLLNFIINESAKLPFAYTSNIWLNEIQLILIILICVFLFLWIVHNKKSHLIFSLAMILMFSSYAYYSDEKAGSRKDLIVYEQFSYPAFAYLCSFHAIISYSKLNQYEKASIERHLRSNRIQKITWLSTSSVVAKKEVINLFSKF